MIAKNTYNISNLVIAAFTLITNVFYGLSVPVKLLTTHNKFEAGSTIVLKFESKENTSPHLYLSYSYGDVIIKPIRDNNILKYKIPLFVSNKTGLVSWQLINYKLMGTFYIYAQQKTHSIETYLGPPSVKVGKTNFSMLVSIPTDAYDNPLENNTPVFVTHQFLNKQITNSNKITNRIHFKRLYAYNKTGRMLISANCLNKSSKALTLNVMPGTPRNFSIYTSRHHNYADGNQITTFKTSQIKDKHNNVVSNGTLVTFVIKTNKNVILKTSGLTINGVATAKMLHPDNKETWQVKAYIDGMANSNKITLQYKTAIKDFTTNFSINNRTISIGPLKSFLNQVAPDGIGVTLTLYKNENKVDTFYKETHQGSTHFKLDINRVPKGVYTVTIKTAGILKKYQNIKL